MTTMGNFFRIAGFVGVIALVALVGESRGFVPRSASHHARRNLELSSPHRATTPFMFFDRPNGNHGQHSFEGKEIVHVLDPEANANGHEKGDASSSALFLGNATQRPVKLRGPLTADGNRRPSVEQGLRYSKDEWLQNLLFLPKSYVLYRIKWRLLLNAVVASVVTCLYNRFQMASIPVLGHSISGGFLSLLLVFRQNSAYARFYEARTLWSDATAYCRMLALDTVTNLRFKAPVAAQKLLALTAAFPDALTYTCLSRRYPLAHNVKKLVIPRYPDQGTILQPVTILLLMMQETVQEAMQEFERDPLDNFNLYELLDKMHKLTDIVTSCEKIVKTPVPWSYTRHASRFLTVWCGTLASALVGTLGWLTVPTVVLISWSLLGLEEIGHLMENPYLGYRRSRRARMTQPYDIGIPVFVLSNQARLELEAIAAIPDRP